MVRFAFMFKFVVVFVLVMVIFVFVQMDDFCAIMKFGEQCGLGNGC